MLNKRQLIGQRLVEQIAADGYGIAPLVLDAATVAWCSEQIDEGRKAGHAASVANSAGTYGLRNLTDVVPAISRLVEHPKVAELVTEILGSRAFMVRATLFDKTPGANWGVFWHQDKAIAVVERHEVAGFSSWTRKAGVQCVQAPPALMGQVLAVRLHLDACTKTNGALKVLPGSHRMANATTEEIDRFRNESAPVTCEVPVGGALLMRPLLLHASSPMEAPTSRRVIHFEFAAFDLPKPLRWRYRLPVVKDGQG